MALYQFNLPEQTNDGLSSYDAAREAWENAALAEAGGFTDLGKQFGAWRDPATGAVYRETMHAYQVATTRDVADNLATRAFELFPDQLAFFVAELGEARIVERQAVRQAA